MKTQTTKIVLAVLLATTLSLAFNALSSSAHPTLRIVPDNYRTIQEAVIAASPRDEIYVRSGRYVETVYIDKPLTLTGENRSTTIIDVWPIADITPQAIDIMADNVEIKEFTIECSVLPPEPPWPDGIIINDCSGSNITNNEIRGFLNGITIWIGSDHNIRSNHIEMNLGSGVWLENSINNRIVRNTFYMNGVGIQTISSSNNTIYHNNFDKNGPPQAHITPGDVNTWDQGYPVGGNYWSDYHGVDLYSGPYQNETGKDGIGDTPYTIDENNQDNYPLLNPWTPPDIAVVDVTPSKTLVGRGLTLRINITTKNQGSKIELFNVTACANTTTINTLTNIILKSGNSTTIIFAWNTAGFAKGNYTITATATPLPGETDTTDNTRACWVVVTIMGDADGDFDCDCDDVFTYVAPAYGTQGPPKKYPPDPKYNPYCDFDGDGDVDADDVFTYLAPNYGKSA